MNRNIPFVPKLYLQVKHSETVHPTYAISATVWRENTIQVAFYSPLLSFQDRDLIALRITDANIKGASSATAHQPKVELLSSAVVHSLLCSEYLLNRDMNILDHF